ncbi:CdaR family transcriptional regulator [Cutibacterium sp.]|uniref:PucR family transcriptional regulator n=1 Tax=Cutibacterium sp. TaxID=1912221 RepID=UPI0026DAAD51|nr:helix-turn-helix domain-containing protein [Cutibacterium sp.]MDO4411800.1 helix-turn-helix domain-containing protein [Cutibacterium sp.]
MSSDRTRRAIAKRLTARTSAMTTATLEEMSRRHSWFRDLSAEERSWISIVARSGIDGFVRWFADDDAEPYSPIDVFDVAPRSMTRKISLHQTVELVRTTLDVVEDRIETEMPRGDRQVLRTAIAHYSREVAFAAAEVYARAAERRGTWDERLESLVVDAVVRADADEQLVSRASTLGWRPGVNLCVVVGRAPTIEHELHELNVLRRDGERMQITVLAALQSDRLVVILSSHKLVDDTATVATTEALAGHFGPGPIVVGPVVADLTLAPISARAALSGARAARAWPEGPRVMAAVDLLPERVLSGDEEARAWLVEEVYNPLAAASGDLMDTTVSFLDHGCSVEGTGRSMFIHPNTVRYRLKRIQDITGYSPSDPREAYVLRLAITLGRLKK